MLKYVSVYDGKHEYGTGAILVASVLGSARSGIIRISLLCSELEMLSLLYIGHAERCERNDDQSIHRRASSVGYTW